MNRITTRLSALLLAVLLLLTGCSQALEKTETTESATLQATTETSQIKLTEAESKRLADRREAVVAYMNRMAKILWRSSETITYTLKSNLLPEADPETDVTRLTVQAGRLYRGLPYTYAGNGDLSFLDFASMPDESGVYTVSGLDWKDLSGGFSSARVGNDCSTALTQAWAQVATSVEVTNTAYMTQKKGYLPVGDYKVSAEELTDTEKDCMNNGFSTMYECYAKLAAGDGVVRRCDGAGHAMMITAVCVERSASGGINGAKSFVTVTHQTRGKYQRNVHEFDETAGEEVFPWYGIGDRFSFAELFDQGYLPITCKELIDPTPVPEPTVKDSLGTPTLETLFTGTITTDRLIDRIEAKIETETGEPVGALALSPTRKEKRSFPVETLLGGDAVGSASVDTLPTGSYRFTLTVRLTTGQEIPVRTLSFTK